MRLKSAECQCQVLKLPFAAFRQQVSPSVQSLLWRRIEADNRSTDGLLGDIRAECVARPCREGGRQ